MTRHQSNEEPGDETLDVLIVEDGRSIPMPDRVAAEEPLEIRVVTEGRERSVAITMRTPGQDLELVAGFLYAEGVVKGPDDLLTSWHDPEVPGGSVFTVELREGLALDLAPLERHFFATSACGVCGKSNLRALLLKRRPEIPGGPILQPEAIYELTAEMLREQKLYAGTGGLHAAALFSVGGELLAVREDVGRHNALDKLLGWAFLQGRLPLGESVVVVSGRAGFEIVQKTLAAGAPVLCAVSAPSTLAVALARDHGLTLLAFLRDRRFNVYAGAHRISGL